MSTRWPNSNDYSDGSQEPWRNFSDPDLRAAEVVVDAMGLPRPYAGNFADVYQFRAADGKKSWAVKCFTKQVARLEDRYREISLHLQQCRLKLAVEFKYLEEGIRIQDEWYPVLKMDWVEGQTLNEFVRQNLHRPKVLESLYHVWLKVELLLSKA